jgi:hypothetical protein
MVDNLETSSALFPDSFNPFSRSRVLSCGTVKDEISAAFPIPGLLVVVGLLLFLKTVEMALGAVVVVVVA